MIDKIFKFISPEKLAIIVSGIVYFSLAGLGVFGLFFTVNHYHTTWKEIFLIIISVNLIGVLGYYFSFLAKEIQSSKKQAENIIFEKYSIDSDNTILEQTSMSKEYFKNFDKECKFLNLKIILIILVIISSLFLVCFYLYNTFSKNEEININNFENSYKFSNEYEFGSIPQKEDVNILLEAESKMAEFFQHSTDKTKNNQMFIAFLNILYSYSKREYDFIPKENVNNTYTIGNLKGNFITTRYIDNYPDGYYKITNPKINSIFYTYIGEGCYEFFINYEYLQGTYSKYLSSDMQEYLKFKSKQLIDLKYTPINTEISSVDESELKDWILNLQNLVKKYPNFILKKYVESEIWSYTSDFIWNSHTFDINTHKLSNKSYNAYVNFLKSDNKNTNEYKVINEAFTILKNNNFEYNEIFNNFHMNYVDKHPKPHNFILNK